MKKLIAVIPILAVLGFFGLLFYQAIGILGPRDNPGFDQMDWASFEFTYWIKISEKKKETHTLTEVTEAQLEELFSKLHVEEIRGSSLGISPQGILATRDHKKWHFSVVFEDRFDFGLQRDSYYAYVVNTKNYAFYKFLKQLCLQDARQQYPDIGKPSIILRSNVALSSYKAYHKELAPEPVADTTPSNSE